jgi:hypothetical protein
MSVMLHPVLSAAYAALFVHGIAAWRRGAPAGLSLMLLAVTAALLWDNLALTAGAWLPASKGFERAHLARFWLHACVTPLHVPVSFTLVRRTGAAWTRRPAAAVAVLFITIGLIALELVFSVARLSLTPVREDGILTYEPIGREAWAGGVMIAAVMVSLLAAGWIVFRRGGPAAPLAGALLMLAGAAVTPLIGMPSLHNLFEFVLAACLWAGAARLTTHAHRGSQIMGG